MDHPYNWEWRLLCECEHAVRGAICAPRDRQGRFVTRAAIVQLYPGGRFETIRI